MELKRRIKPELVFIVIYIVMAIAFFWVGFQPAGAKNYDIISTLDIPSIGLNTDVARIEPENNKLNTPDEIVGSYQATKNKTLLIGHSSTVFSDLYTITQDAPIYYQGKTYTISDIVVLSKSEINMRDLLKDSDQDTVVIMTCAGQDLGNGDATHRLIITAINASDASE